MFYKNKKVLVTGGTGLIGIPLVNDLLAQGSLVRVTSLDAPIAFKGDVEFIKGDLCNADFCDRAVNGMDFVFHLAGIKGGIGVAKSKAASFLIKNILMNTLVMESARRAKVEKFLYASSICIYPPAELFEEKNAGTGLPHPSDKFGGIAKLVGEMQIEAYKAQYNMENFFIARPANTYGPYDNFNPESALVIPSLIYRALNGENPLTVWGDGSAVRDFIFADDAAKVLSLMVEKNASGPFNVGTGEALSIKTVVEVIAESAQKYLKDKLVVKWDSTRPSGEKYRVASAEKVKAALSWSPKVSFKEGIAATVDWYFNNRQKLPQRYSILS